MKNDAPIRTIRAIRDTLAALLPDPRTTLLLRACVQDGSSLNEAWREWRRETDDPRGHLASRNELGRLLPLLESNLARNSIAIDDELRPYLRTARVHERLRFKAYQRGFAEIVGSLLKNGVDFTLLKGAALARTVFDPPFTRHCHDLDLMVQAEDTAAACAALGSQGYRPSPVGHGSSVIRHSSGIPVVLHSSLLASSVYSLAIEDVLGRRRRLRFPIGALPVLSPEDSLVHVLAHAATVERPPSPGWAIDSFRLMTSGAELDWRRVGELCDRSGLALPIEPMLRYLKRALEGPVPDGLCAELRSGAERRGVETCREAIHGILLARRGLLRRVFLGGSNRSRYAIARQLILPPRRAAFRLIGGYLRRRIPFAGRRVAARAR